MIIADNSIILAIKKAVEKQIQQVIEDEAKEAAIRVERKVKGIAIDVATRLANDCVFERFDRSIYMKFVIKDSKL